MSSAIQFDISLYENLRGLIRKNPEQARTFLRMWLESADVLIGIGMMPDLIDDTAKQVGIHSSEVLAGIIAGCLNEQYINENMAPILGKELLPIGILTLRDTSPNGEELYFNWRKWFHLEKRTTINADTIATIIGNIMKYARFLDFDKLSEALETNQLICFKGLGDQQVKLLPYYPALRYQEDLKGEFSVGKFMTERNAGFFDCGYIDPAETHCLACGRRDLTRSKDNKHIYCRACNAGYYPKEGDAE